VIGETTPEVDYFGGDNVLRIRVLLVLAGLWLAAVTPAVALPQSGRLNVVTTTEDLASLAREVGGDRITVESIAKGYQDPHAVEAKPSFVLRLHRADLLIVVGLDMEAAWLPPLITQSRNAKIQRGAEGYLDASRSAQILDQPTGPIDRSMGDVHPQGNPHYWLDPANGRRIAQGIQKKLSEMRPAEGPYFAQRYADFDRRLAEAEKRWDVRMAPFKGVKVVTYHRSWSNFTARFNLDVIGYAEPRPGISPSPNHTIRLIQEMKRQGARLIIVEPYFDLKTPRALARETGAKVLVLPPSVGGEPEIKDYIQLFEYDINLIATALK
jgi:ABC-type Zn uptake system ZnuABC Zn-binding protein ZnuA